jgi:adenylate cyclase
VDQAEADRLLEMAAAALLDGPRRYTPTEMYQQAGVDEETARAIWRAMGFPHVPDDERAFTDRDLEALVASQHIQAGGLLGPDDLLRQARVLSQAMATVAAANLEIAGRRDRSPERFARFAAEVLPVIDDLVVYLYHRQLLAALERVLVLDLDEPDHPLPTLAVGFADLVGFTRTANQVEEDELARLIEGFVGSAADVVAEGGGRVVKMLGDEVMFAAEEVAATRIALRLVEEVGDHDGVPALRAGVACGPVVLRHGDVFGTPVNLAHRLVELARPGSVLVDEALHAALGSADDIETQRVTSIRRVRGLGHARAYVARRA